MMKFLKHSRDKAFDVYKSDENLEKILSEITNENGVDGVIICAGTTSNSLIELAGRVTKER